MPKRRLILSTLAATGGAVLVAVLRRRSRMNADQFESDDDEAIDHDIADAAAPLYQSLDEGQKHRFTMLAQLDRSRMAHRQHWRHHRHGDGHDMMHKRDRGPAGTEDTAPKPQ